jgi:hypothetical protein
MDSAFRNSLLILVLCGLPLTGCIHRQPPAVATPPQAQLPQHTMTAADKRFSAGEFLQAAQAYETYLQAGPDVPNRDRAIFRLAISYALAGGEQENFRKTQSLLRTLFTQYPESQYKSVSQYILSLQAEIDLLRVDIREQEDRIREQDASLQEKDGNLEESLKNIQAKEKALREKDRLLRERGRSLGEKDKLLTEMEDKILSLSLELERMKKIDLQRRPARPPD